MLAELGRAGGFLMYALTGPGAWSWQGWRAGGIADKPAPQRAPAKAAGKGSTARGGGKKASGRAPARAAA